MSDTCALCGKPALGFAVAGERRLCHHETRDCYSLWTLYGCRPGMGHECFRCIGRGFHPESSHALAHDETCEVCGGVGKW